MFVDIGNAKIYTTAFGSTTAPVIVGIGGWIGSWELWAEPFAILSRSWRTIAFDHRGTGATLAPVESITFDRLVNDVFAVLDAYAVEQCVLAAESAGALTALGAALRNPQLDDPNYVMIDLEFDTSQQADILLAAMRGV
ncbi:MAG TPA: alpha/beta fold hydrolase [Anaerolineae bacterium]|nr:alpha/beta fold hydrolase [Anaerolineae bacterium]HNU03987.1 alpha/beta fold hydrolase [Anaerolineae bacterium]